MGRLVNKAIFDLENLIDSYLSWQNTNHPSYQKLENVSQALASLIREWQKLSPREISLIELCHIDSDRRTTFDFLLNQKEFFLELQEQKLALDEVLSDFKKGKGRPKNIDRLNLVILLRYYLEDLGFSLNMYEPGIKSKKDSGLFWQVTKKVLEICSDKIVDLRPLLKAALSSPYPPKGKYRARIAQRFDNLRSRSDQEQEQRYNQKIERIEERRKRLQNFGGKKYLKKS